MNKTKNPALAEYKKFHKQRRERIAANARKRHLRMIKEGFNDSGVVAYECLLDAFKADKQTKDKAIFLAGWDAAVLRMLHGDKKQ